MSSRLKLLCCLLLVVGCGPTKMVTESHRDSVIVHVLDSIILRDTVIMVEVPKESDKSILPDTDTSYLQTSLAESEAYVANGRLHHSLRNKSEMLLPVKVQYVDRARVEKSEMIAWRHMVETVKVEKELSKWQSFIMALGYGLLIAAAGWLVWKLSKIIRL